MQSHVLALSLVLTFSSAALAQTPATKLAPQKGWLNNLDAARAQAQKTGKPMMVVFRCDP